VIRFEQSEIEILLEIVHRLSMLLGRADDFDPVVDSELPTRQNLSTLLEQQELDFVKAECSSLPQSAGRDALLNAIERFTTEITLDSVNRFEVLLTKSADLISNSKQHQPPREPEDFENKTFTWGNVVFPEVSSEMLAIIKKIRTAPSENPVRRQLLKESGLIKKGSTGFSGNFWFNPSRKLVAREQDDMSRRIVHPVRYVIEQVQRNNEPIFHLVDQTRVKVLLTEQYGISDPREIIKGLIAKRIPSGEKDRRKWLLEQRGNS
jgi:hypothetical protein